MIVVLTRRPVLDYGDLFVRNGLQASWTVGGGRWNYTGFCTSAASSPLAGEIKVSSVHERLSVSCTKCAFSSSGKAGGYTYSSF